MGNFSCCVKKPNFAESSTEIASPSQSSAVLPETRSNFHSIVETNERDFHSVDEPTQYESPFENDDDFELSSHLSSIDSNSNKCHRELHTDSISGTVGSLLVVREEAKTKEKCLTSNDGKVVMDMESIESELSVLETEKLEEKLLEMDELTLEAKQNEEIDGKLSTSESVKKLYAFEDRGKLKKQKTANVSPTEQLVFSQPITSCPFPNIALDDRPVRPQPTPLRRNLLSPDRNVEELCDILARPLENTPTKKYWQRKRLFI